jgi:hypothetical protein
MLSIEYWLLDEKHVPMGFFYSVPNHLNLGSQCMLCFNLVLKTWMIWFLSK